MMEIVGGFIFGMLVVTVLTWMEFRQQREIGRIHRKLDLIIAALESDIDARPHPSAP